MRIAYLSSVFPQLTCTFVINEVDEHDRAGDEVLPLSSDRPPDNIPLSEKAQYWRERTVFPPSNVARIVAFLRMAICCPIRTVQNIWWLFRLLFVGGLEFLMGLRELGSAAYMVDACRRHGVEHLHIHFAGRSLTAGIFLGRWIDTPISCTVHAYDLWTRNGRNLSFRLGRCQFVVAISNYNVEYLRKHCGESIARLCHVVHCGIDTESFVMRNEQPVDGPMLVVASLYEKKGQRYLIDACSILKKKGRTVRCQIIGQGPERPQLCQQIEDLGLTDEVEMLGAMANDQLGKHFAAAQMFVLPAVVASNGDQDGIPVCLMEAMASGVPVVSTTVSGIPELLVHGEVGTLVPPRDAGALAAALEALGSDQSCRERLACAGRKVVVDHFNIRTTSKQLRSLFAGQEADKAIEPKSQ